MERRSGSPSLSEPRVDAFRDQVGVAPGVVAIEVVGVPLGVGLPVVVVVVVG